MKSMSAFETWQVMTAIAQTAILFVTLFAAVYIGLKQAEIASRQADISQVQADISKVLADLPFTVSMEIAYDPAQRRINLANKGQSNIYLWGTKLGDGAKLLEKEPRLITPGGFYYLLADSLGADLRRAIDGGSSGVLPLVVYVTNEPGSKYAISSLVIPKVADNQLTIHMQTTSIQRAEW